MYFKRIIFLSLCFMSLLPSTVSSSDRETVLWGSAELIGSIFIGDWLYRSFTEDTQKMKELENILRSAGIRLKKDTKYGLFSIFSFTTFMGYESTLNIYHTKIEEHQQCEGRRLLKLSIAPLVIRLGVEGTLKLLKAMYGSSK